VGPSWNCAVLLPPGGRAWLFLCWHRPRNDRKPARSWMFRILSTRFLSRLREWNYLDCFGFDVEKWRTGNRISRALRTLHLRTRKPEKVAVSIPRAKKPVQIHGWRHPRELMRGVDKAIPGLVGKQTAFAESTRIHVVARCAGEQVERDREPPRRGIRPPRSLPSRRETYPIPTVRQETRRTKPWKRLEQALRTTDLLLHSGGWGVVVFDLGGISWVDARRINLSMWFRFRRAVENTPTILLLLGEESCAKSCASLVLRCQRKADKWSRAAETIHTGASTFEGFEVQGEVTRSRVLSQPADFARWQTHTP
jgi:hypothetical protein